MADVLGVGAPGGSLADAGRVVAGGPAHALNGSAERPAG
jgi:hypothetical protein